VLLLGRHFLREFSRKFQKPFAELSDEAVRCFLEYRWPGNVRELRNLIERVVLLEDGTTLEAEHLPAELFSRSGLVPGAAPRGRSTLPTLAEMEAEHIAEVLRLTAGNKSQAARILGISRQGLIEKLRRFRIEESAGRQVS
jgi:transcriptional regulator with PAS, ATPase and Fis domain